MPDIKKLITDIESQLKLTVSQIRTVSGGSINQVYKLQTSAQSFLLKVNSRYHYPDMFKLEREGLATIRSTQTIAVPELVLQGDIEDDSYLVLEWIEPGPNTTASFIKLGEQLANLHRVTSTFFGFSENNYMGSLPQSNRKHKRWNDFFVNERLEPMAKIAIDKNKLNNSDISKLEKLYQKLPSLFDEEPPALVHGDLWNGNYLIDKNGRPYIFDPAVSYSNREFDIAMTTLFGGFDRTFYEAYNNAFPLQAGWEQRVKIWNLYPLLLHLNLFGSSYLSQIRSCINQFA